MPAWGQRYRADAAEWLSYQGAPGEAEALAQLRVLALVEDVASLQEQSATFGQTWPGWSEKIP